MPGTRFKEDLLDLDKGEIRRPWPGRTMAGKSAGAMVIELGITLAGAESRIATPGWCLRCRVSQDPQRSTSQYPNVFCSEYCDQELICTALASLALEDCNACTSGWKISSCQPKKLLLHNKKEWSSYGKQAIEAYG